MNRSNRKKEPMPPGGMVLIALMLVLITGLSHYLIVNRWGFGASRDRHVTDTLKGVNYDFSSAASFYSYDARFFYFCTKDGMKYVSSNGDVRWQEMFNLSKPIMVTYGEMVAVGEERGRRVFVFDSDGLVFSKTFDNPVLTFSVNPNGFLSVVLELSPGYAVYVYHRRSPEQPIYENVVHDANMVPTSVSVSADGRYAVIALLDFGVRLTSQIRFCYINEGDAWNTVDGMFATTRYENQIAHTVRFMEDNKVLVITDERIDCFQPERGGFPNAEWSVPFHNKIHPLAFHGDSRFAFATGDKFLNDPGAAEPGEVHIYNMRGERTGTFALGRKATYLGMGHSHVIVGGDRRFYILDRHGKPVWDYQAIHDTRDFIFLDNIDTVLIAGNSRASVMKRVRGRPETAAFE
jgi:hypothetical protein